MEAFGPKKNCQQQNGTFPRRISRQPNGGSDATTTAIGRWKNRGRSATRARGTRPQHETSPVPIPRRRLSTRRHQTTQARPQGGAMRASQRSTSREIPHLLVPAEEEETVEEGRGSASAPRPARWSPSTLLSGQAVSGSTFRATLRRLLPREEEGAACWDAAPGEPSPQARIGRCSAQSPLCQTAGNEPSVCVVFKQ